MIITMEFKPVIFHFLLIATHVWTNKRARVLRQNLARGLSYAGSRAVRLPSKRQKMSRNSFPPDTPEFDARVSRIE